MPFTGGPKPHKYITLNRRTITTIDPYRIFRIGSKDLIISESLLSFDVEQSIIEGEWHWTKDGFMRPYQKNDGSTGYELLHRYLMACGLSDVINFFDPIEQESTDKWNCQRHVMQVRRWDRKAGKLDEFSDNYSLPHPDFQRQVAAILREADDYDTGYEIKRAKSIFDRVFGWFFDWLDSR